MRRCIFAVIASEAKQSTLAFMLSHALLRRSAPRNDDAKLVEPSSPAKAGDPVRRVGKGALSRRAHQSGASRDGGHAALCPPYALLRRTGHSAGACHRVAGGEARWRSIT